MISIRLSSDALGDLNDGFDFYEAQEPGLGEYFKACLIADIEGLKLTAGIHRTVHRNMRRILSRTFPFAIFYTWSPEESCAIIWAVIDCRRDPTWIQRHLDSASQNAD